jgi:hypothetical protein
LAKYEVKPIPNKYKTQKFGLLDTFGQYSCEFWESKNPANLGPSYDKYFSTVPNEKDYPVCLSNWEGSAETTCALRFPPGDSRCGQFSIKSTNKHGALIEAVTNWGGSKKVCLNVAYLNPGFRPGNDPVQPNGKLYPQYNDCSVWEQDGFDRIRWAWVEEKKGPWKGFCYKGDRGEFDWCFKPT